MILVLKRNDDTLRILRLKDVELRNIGGVKHWMLYTNPKGGAIFTDAYMRTYDEIYTISDGEYCNLQWWQGGDHLCGPRPSVPFF